MTKLLKRAALAALAAALFASATPAVAKGKRSEGQQLVSAAAKASRAGKPDEALALYAKAIATGTLKGIDLAGAHNQRAVILSETGKKEAAVAEMGNAIAAAPKQPFYYGNRARILSSLKRYEAAAVDFGKVIELSARPDAYAYTDRCQAWARAGKTDKAKADCTKALEIKPGHAKAKRLLAKLGG